MGKPQFIPPSYPTLILYDCCEVTAKGMPDDPCWSCQMSGKYTLLVELPTYHPWIRFMERTPSQFASNYYL